MALNFRKDVAKLLDNFEAVNKNDVYKFTKGHLNESRVFRNAYNVEQVKWTNHSSKNKTPASKPRKNERQNTYNTSTLRTSHSVEMFDMFANFSLGVLPSQYVAEERIKERLCSPDSVAETLDDIRPMSPVVLPPLLQHNAFAVTKTEKYTKMKETNILLGLDDLKTTNVMAGQPLVQGIEFELAQDIAQCCAYGDVTARQRLVCWRTAIGKLVNQSAAYGTLIKEIELEYFNYLVWLKTRNNTQNESLEYQIKLLKPDTIVQEKSAVLENSEDALLALIKDNKILREKIGKLTEEVEVMKIPRMWTPMSARCRPQRIETKSEKIDRLRGDILERHNELQALRADVYKNTVPRSVVEGVVQDKEDVVSQTLAYKSGATILQHEVDTLTAELTAFVSESKQGTEILSACTDVILTGDPLDVIAELENGTLELIDADKFGDDTPWDFYIS